MKRARIFFLSTLGQFLVACGSIQKYYENGYVMRNEAIPTSCNARGIEAFKRANREDLKKQNLVLAFSFFERKARRHVDGFLFPPETRAQGKDPHLARKLVVDLAQEDCDLEVSDVGYTLRDTGETKPEAEAVVTRIRRTYLEVFGSAPEIGKTYE